MGLGVKLDSEQFKLGMRQWASGVTVVTSRNAAGDIQGMTATAFSSVSLDPPQVLVCVNRAVGTASAILESGSFAVNILRADQEAVSNTFASASDPVERFASVSWELGPHGSPILLQSIASIECTVAQETTAGSHWVIIGEVQSVTCRDGDPLLYCGGRYRNLNPAD